MPDRYEIEELIIDDSFINYCFNRNPSDTAIWKDYLAAHPEEAATVAEAREMVLSITLMLQETEQEATIVPLHRSRKNLQTLFVAAAVAAVIAVSTFFIFRNEQPEILAAQSYAFTTALAEKRKITLPDNSTVLLNAGSELLLDKDFGTKNRLVSLKGEGYFEVQHNAEKPFIVGVQGYDVKVLGTVFNVKAYPGEKKSETSLISGKVEIYLKHATTAYKTLRPEEKFVITENLEALPASTPADIKPRTASTAVMPLSYNRNQVNLETAWSQNRLVFENETFSDIREKLERWFNVQIIFEDKIVEKYTFTATFEKEDINQVMKALQASYGFKYSIKENEIKISHQNRR